MQIALINNIIQNKIKQTNFRLELQQQINPKQPKIASKINPITNSNNDTKINKTSTRYKTAIKYNIITATKTC